MSVHAERPCDAAQYISTFPCDGCRSRWPWRCEHHAPRATWHKQLGCACAGVRCCSRKLLAIEAAAALRQLGVKSLTTVALTLSTEEQQSRKSAGTATIVNGIGAQLPAGLQHLAKHHWTGGVCVEGQDLVIILHKPGPRPQGLPYAKEPGSRHQYRAANLRDLHPDDCASLLQHGIASGQYKMQLLVDGKLWPQPFTVQLAVVGSTMSLTDWDEACNNVQQELGHMYDCGYRLEWSPATTAMGGHPSGYSLLKMATSRAPAVPYAFAAGLWSATQGLQPCKELQSTSAEDTGLAESDSPMSDAQHDYAGCQAQLLLAECKGTGIAGQLASSFTQEDVEAADLLLSLQNDSLLALQMCEDAAAAMPVAGRKRACTAMPLVEYLHGSPTGKARRGSTWHAGAALDRLQQVAASKPLVHHTLAPVVHRAARGCRDGKGHIVTRQVNKLQQLNAPAPAYQLAAPAQAVICEQQQTQYAVAGCRQSTRLSMKRARAKSYDSGHTDMTAVQDQTMHPSELAVLGDQTQPAGLPAGGSQTAGLCARRLQPTAPQQLTGTLRGAAVAMASPGLKRAAVAAVSPALRRVGVTTASPLLKRAAVAAVSPGLRGVQLAMASPGLRTGPRTAAWLAADTKKHRNDARTHASAARTATQSKGIIIRSHPKPRVPSGTGKLVTTETIRTDALAPTELLSAGAVTTSVVTAHPPAVVAAIQQVAAAMLQQAAMRAGHASAPALPPQEGSNELAEWLEHRIKSHGGCVWPCSQATSQAPSQTPSNNAAQQQASNIAAQQQASNIAAQQQAGNIAVQQQAGNIAVQQQAGNTAVQQQAGKDGTAQLGVPQQALGQAPSKEDIRQQQAGKDGAAQQGIAAAKAAAVPTARIRHCPPPGFIAAASGVKGPSNAASKTSRQALRRARQTPTKPAIVARLRHHTTAEKVPGQVFPIVQGKRVTADNAGAATGEPVLQSGPNKLAGSAAQSGDAGAAAADAASTANGRICRRPAMTARNHTNQMKVQQRRIPHAPPPALAQQQQPQQVVPLQSAPHGQQAPQAQQAQQEQSDVAMKTASMMQLKARCGSAAEAVHPKAVLCTSKLAVASGKRASPQEAATAHSQRPTRMRHTDVLTTAELAAARDTAELRHGTSVSSTHAAQEAAQLDSIMLVKPVQACSKSVGIDGVGTGAACHRHDIEDDTTCQELNTRQRLVDILSGRARQVHHRTLGQQGSSLSAAATPNEVKAVPAACAPDMTVPEMPDQPSAMPHIPQRSSPGSDVSSEGVRAVLQPVTTHAVGAVNTAAKRHQVAQRTLPKSQRRRMELQQQQELRVRHQVPRADCETAREVASEEARTACGHAVECATIVATNAEEAGMASAKVARQPHATTSVQVQSAAGVVAAAAYPSMPTDKTTSAVGAEAAILVASGSHAHLLSTPAACDMLQLQLSGAVTAPCSAKSEMRMMPDWCSTEQRSPAQQADLMDVSTNSSNQISGTDACAQEIQVVTAQAGGADTATTNAVVVRCAEQQRSLLQELLAQNVASPLPAAKAPPVRDAVAHQLHVQSSFTSAVAQVPVKQDAMGQACAAHVASMQPAASQNRRPGPANQYHKGQPLSQLQLSASAASTTAANASLAVPLKPKGTGNLAAVENIIQACGASMAPADVKQSGSSALTAAVLREHFAGQVERNDSKGMVWQKRLSGDSLQQ